MKIVVLAGGLSPERDVSLTSGALIANSLIRSGNDVMLVDLYLGNLNKDIPFLYKNSDSDYEFSYKISDTCPDLDKIKNESLNGDVLIGPGVLDACRDCDVVFMALHGSIGENGKLQALFDIYNITYTGSGYIGSLLAMDKDLSKKIMVMNDINTPKWRLVSLESDINYDNFSFPCVIKPCSCGSSVGVSIVNNKDELLSSLELAKCYEDSIICEEVICGREFSVGVLNGVALPAIEIIPKSGFYDYKNKYQDNATIEVCPADISDDVSKMLSSSALKVHDALRLGAYSRIDFIVDSNNNAYCLEANTLPGMTNASLLPKEAMALGINYDELCMQIVKSCITSEN